jgi:ABC-type transporter Mla subunit MlaD
MAYLLLIVSVVGAQARSRRQAPLPSDLPSELARWFQNMQRMLDRLAQAAEQQNQLHATVARLVRENEELREEMENLRNMVTRLTNQRAETRQTLRGLAAYVSAVKDRVLRQPGDGI